MLGVHVHFTGPVVSFASICVQLPRAKGENCLCFFSVLDTDRFDADLLVFGDCFCSPFFWRLTRHVSPGFCVVFWSLKAQTLP